MKTAGRVLLLVTALWLGLAGCGGSSSSSGSPGGGQPAPQACSGLAIKGTMVDSLTGQPVTQGWAVLESGTQLLATAVFNFAPLQRVSAGTKGDFELCVATISSPSAVVLVALDSAGKAYPPFVSAVSGATDLGTVRDGGLHGNLRLRGVPADYGVGCGDWNHHQRSDFKNGLGHTSIRYNSAGWIEVNAGESQLVEHRDAQPGCCADQHV